MDVNWCRWPRRYWLSNSAEVRFPRACVAATMQHSLFELPNPMSPILFIKSALPKPLYSFIRSWYRARRVRAHHASWDRAVSAIQVFAPAHPARSIIILPSDPDGIVGAVGDDAMISAAIDHFRRDCAELTVKVLCRAGFAEQIVRERGWLPLAIPASRDYPARIAELLGRVRSDALVIIGADILDGYYSPQYAMELLTAADIAARFGMRSIVLGFSFNSSPAGDLHRCFARLDKRVMLNVRDQISLERLSGFAVTCARLVADSAFTLQPSDINADYRNWIQAERRTGRIVVGINMHPMLIREQSAEETALLVRQMAAAICANSEGPPVSWILVPHDYRDEQGLGDGICLRPLRDLLAAQGIRYRYFEGLHRAAAIKALVGQLDGVVTGRMHLAIASLGMGVPVLCLTYQDKFEGLIRHFNLPPSTLLTPDQIKANNYLANQMKEYLHNLPDLNVKVRQRLPGVLELADKNFSEV